MSTLRVSPTAGVSVSPVLSSSPSIVVAGAGCVGLAAAMQLAQAGYQNIHIVTEGMTPNTTSDQAGKPDTVECRTTRSAGMPISLHPTCAWSDIRLALSPSPFLVSFLGALWRPFGEVSDSNRSVFARWGKETFDFLNDLRLAHGAEKTGICLVSGYEVFQTKQEAPFWKDDVIGFKMIERKELAEAGLDAEFGFFYTSLIVDMSLYMAWMHRELFRLGVRVHIRRLDCLSDLHTLFPGVTLIVNATGLASAKLVKDDSVFPVAGHIVKIKCPSVHHFYMDSDNTTYVFPRLHDLVVGGTYWKGVSNTQPNIDTRNDIITRASRLVPDLAQAQIVGEYVGLRPYREVTRLELEYPATHPNSASQQLMSKPMPSQIRVPVVHNYGHGGSGITLHWGCATTVMELAKPILGAPTKPTLPRIPSKL